MVNLLSIGARHVGYLWNLGVHHGFNHRPISERDRNTPKPCTEPPYSAGQDSANDLNANLKYPTLDKRIADTYAKRSTATLKNSLYDSYLRAFRWATDRVGDHGVVAYVSNGGWIDSNTADGVRLSLADEYSRVYVYNLRGNQRTSGELSRKEGGKVFGSGSRNTVAIFIGVKDPDHSGPCEVQYRDIGDYLTRERKLEIVAAGDLETVEWQSIMPNEHGDWINQRSGDFVGWPAIGDKDGGLRVFGEYSGGLLTARDPWVYNFSMARLESNVRSMIAFYNSQLAAFEAFCEERRISAVDRKASIDSFIDPDPTKISWGGGLQSGLGTGSRMVYNDDVLVDAVYRPFSRQHVAFDRQVNCRVYRLPAMFPTRHHSNFGFYVVGAGSSVPFSAIMSDHVPDRHLTGAGSGGQFFSRWTYMSAAADGALDFETGDDEPDKYGYRRVDNITDEILAIYREAIGDQVTKDDIFFYVYGLLHDPVYRETFAADLKKMLPHIPTPESQERFEQLTAAGRALSHLHIGYETVDPYPLDIQVKAGVDPGNRDTWRVTDKKMKWAKKKDPESGKRVDDVTTLIYSPKVTIAGIPEIANRYMIGSRSALAWIIDRYLVKADSASGIVNDPNDWCDEHDDPKYVVDLIAKVTTVAVETMKIVDSLAESAE
ncbi:MULTISPECIES: type ISP restriction/modification enzyme [Mycolicibacterium]|uniref:type ISP restriction/modification enzyme n=1 Tax=Mycolicibacterium TaxID=1866885 RepID=UPI0003073026|nr:MULTISPECIES: type ISP restriction/modification enzyme [Mycolicibacterium]